MTLADAILEFNVPYANALVGAKIAEIDAPTAGIMAALIAEHGPRLRSFLGADATSRDAIVYFCAVMGQESRMDPTAFNKNFKRIPPIEWIQERLGNRPDPLKGDYGAAMFKARYIIQSSDTPELIPLGKPIVAAARDLDFSDGSPPAKNPEKWILARDLWRLDRSRAGKPSTLTPEERTSAKRVRNQGIDHVIKEYLFKPEWAVPKMAARYAMLLDGAIRKYPSWNPADAATGIYNQGPDGFKTAHEQPTSPQGIAARRHIASVQKHRKWFNDKLSQEV